MDMTLDPVSNEIIFKQDSFRSNFIKMFPKEHAF